MTNNTESLRLSAVTPPRLGDVVGCATLTAKAKRFLGWSAELSIEDGVRGSLEWAEKLPAVLELENRNQLGGELS